MHVFLKTTQSGRWNHRDSFLQPDAFLSHSEAAASTQVLCRMSHSKSSVKQEGKCVLRGKESLLHSFLLSRQFRRWQTPPQTWAERRLLPGGAGVQCTPVEALAGVPSHAASLLSPSDVFPGWSACLDETDDFLGRLLLTAGRSNSD